MNLRANAVAGGASSAVTRYPRRTARRSRIVLGGGVVVAGAAGLAARASPEPWPWRGWRRDRLGGRGRRRRTGHRGRHVCGRLGARHGGLHRRGRRQRRRRTDGRHARCGRTAPACRASLRRGRRPAARASVAPRRIANAAYDDMRVRGREPIVLDLRLAPTGPRDRAPTRAGSARPRLIDVGGDRGLEVRDRLVERRRPSRTRRRGSSASARRAARRARATSAASSGATTSAWRPALNAAAAALSAASTCMTSASAWRARRARRARCLRQRRVRELGELLRGLVALAGLEQLVDLPRLGVGGVARGGLRRSLRPRAGPPGRARRSRGRARSTELVGAALVQAVERAAARAA